MTGRLTGKVAIITGGAGGIGAAAGLLFAQEGARVALVDSDGDAMEGALGDIRAAVSGAQTIGIVADVSHEESAAQAVNAAREALGAVSVLVNCAGIRAYEPLAESKAETWERVLAVNLLSYVWFAKAAIGDLRETRGSVVNVSSTHGVNPRGGTAQYDATKAAIISMTKSLAFEEARHGVRANAVCPGLTITPFHRRRFAAAGRGEDEIAQQAREGCLLGRWAEAREAAYPILWLASDEASYCTGSVLMADGGRYVK